MTTVNCYQSECVNNKNDKCTLDTIHIAFDIDHNYEEFFPCGTYENILMAPEYKEPYFMRVQNPKTKRVEKREMKGKKVELLGMAFYTNNDTRYEENWWLTEEKTGFGAHKENILREPEVARRAITESTPVRELPDEEVCHD